MNHTPGPWRQMPDVPFEITTAGELKDCKRICMVTHERQGLRRGHEEALANARLITAAPTLLAATKVMLLTPHIVGYLKANDPKALEQLQRVIAEAEPAPESARPCGCDPGENHRCEQHRTAVQS